MSLLKLANIVFFFSFLIFGFIRSFTHIIQRNFFIFYVLRLHIRLVRSFFSQQIQDGIHEAKAGLEIRVKDVQNRPPIFQGSLAAIIDEDSPIGTLVLNIQAKDGDHGQPRRIVYDLLTSMSKLNNINVLN